MTRMSLGLGAILLALALAGNAVAGETRQTAQNEGDGSVQPQSPAQSLTSDQPTQEVALLLPAVQAAREAARK